MVILTPLLGEVQEEILLPIQGAAGTIYLTLPVVEAHNLLVAPRAETAALLVHRYREVTDQVVT
jgi:hypothetical protein